MDDGEPISFLGRPALGGRVRVVVLPPADVLEYRCEQWADALVVVERGTLEVECRGGARARFRCGAMLAFAMVEPWRLHNPGDIPLVLSVLTR